MTKFFCILAAGIWLGGLNAAPASSSFSILGSTENMSGDTIIVASICANESYIFDGQILNTPGEYVATYIAADGSDSTVTLQLSVLPLSLTNLNASICAGDTYPFNGDDLNQSGTYGVTLTAENGCDSIVTLNLVVLAPNLTTLEAGICEGTNYLFQGDTLTQSGTYTIVLTAENGCDSIVTLNLKVVPFFEILLKVAICEDEIYVFGGDTLKLPGVYVDSLTAIGGCDSIVTLNLNFLPNASTHLIVGLCIGSEYEFQGDILTDDGTYTAHFTAENGCDSTVVLDLSFVSFFDVQAEATICDGGVYLFGNDVLDAAGTYTQTFIALGGCDSTVTLTLTVLPASNGTEQATICAEGYYEYGGEVLTDAGNYAFIFEGANGCDSTVILTLNVLPAIGSALAATICQGENYAFSGTLLSNSGIYEAILTAENGCDSVVVLTLTVLPSSDTNLFATICAGEAYTYNGDTLTTDGIYNYIFTGANGCDSTVTLVLTVNLTQSVILNENICAGESYDFNGILITDAGLYTAVYTGENGCDSTVTLLLGVLPLQNTAVEATICSNETYAFNGEDLSDAGNYTAVFTGENGCDSTVVLTLNVLHTQFLVISAMICDGDSYEYNGTSLTTSGNYIFVLSGENGCDSTITVALTVLPVAQTIIESTICEGDAYDYNGNALTLSGEYHFTFNGFNGCDSIVTISLVVLPLSSSITVASLCEGSSYLFNGALLSSTGFYQYTLTGANGCDSTASLVLEFFASFDTYLPVSICAGESYVFGNDTLTQSGNYTLLLTAQGGCDSLVTLALNVLPLGESITEASICEGETYGFNGLDLNTSGTYTALLTGANGCDSTAVLNLTVLPLLNSAFEATICANEAYPFHGQSLNLAGTYTAVLTGSNGCDSTVVLTLNVLPFQQSGLSASVCANQSYDFNGQSLSQEGIYTAVLQGVNGCDSIVTLTLDVLPLAQSAFTASVCNGETFEYNGLVLTQSGEYPFNYVGAAANGCDSVETLFLTIFPLIPPTNISASICSGESYNFYGDVLTASGTYSEDLSSSVGCDSVIVLILTVNPSPDIFSTVTICAGESYPFNGQLLTDPGTYTGVFQTQAGCDSTVVLTLLVNSANNGIMVQGNTITATAMNAAYQWINCATNQPIPGATGSSFTPSTSGNYAVVVTENGCTATSTCVFVQIVSTQEPLGGAAWTLQPNPASSFTQVMFSVDADEDLLLEILDLAGRTLHRQNVATGTRQIDLKLSDIPDGILLVRLANKNGVSTKRIMKGQH
ncbi:MAG: T9SS type A sorting domain-containing protein [Saprospiraceae bacterium]|nr:T9SS type A sorting domain-containing protein [Saprospiraceae bacterium]